MASLLQVRIIKFFILLPLTLENYFLVDYTILFVFTLCSMARLSIL